MPKYFAFLTVMAFNVFIEEKVDVAVIEVGIGGILDYTNILRYSLLHHIPIVCNFILYCNNLLNPVKFIWRDKNLQLNKFLWLFVFYSENVLGSEFLVLINV